MKNVLMIVGVLSAGLSLAQMTAKITIDVAQKGHPVSPTLYGIFMEEISHAFDGGVYAELIRNRSFEDGVLPKGVKLVKKSDGKLKMELESLPPTVPKDKWDMPWPWFNNCGWDPERALLGWTLEKRNGAEGRMELTELNPMNSGSSRSLAIEVKGQVALINSGYWGIHVQEGRSYDLTFFLCPETFTGKVTACLENERGENLGSYVFDNLAVKKTLSASSTLGRGWQKNQATLKAKGTAQKGRFVLLFEGEGKLQVDWVSLFPPTWKNKPNGLRPELAQMLADLKPSYIRYPGGCYVEGISWQNAPDWRKQVMPVEERPGEWGYWQYRSTDGFGYHEFLQFCEDIGADAMYVGFCGMTVHPENNMPLDQLDPVIQQTLDSIEYAIGDTGTKWGKVRARMGHPKPFPLKYVEIGNEHPPAIYGDYYVRFRQAIKAKYPQIIVIMSMFWSGLNQGAIDKAGDANIDMVDEHAYRNADWIRDNFNYFDNYKRKGWSIYVGEYASHNGGGNMYCALGDALYLMMCERNGDLVKMASYAPLFVNVNKRDWGINLIEFDSSRQFAHASYYVQQLFERNRPDVNLKTTLDVNPKPDPKKPLLAGRIGFGAWDTQVEFKELKIDGKDVALDQYDVFAGDWACENGVLKQNALQGAPTMALLKGITLETGTITFKARRVGGREGFLFFLNATGLDSFIFANAGAAGNAFTAIQDRGERPLGSFRGGQATNGKIENEKWYDVTLKVNPTNAELLFGEKRMAEAGVINPASIFAHAGADEKSGDIVVKAVNYNGYPVETEIVLENVKTLKSAKHFVVKSDAKFEENSLENPNKIGIQELPISVSGTPFKVTLPKYSVNLLRLSVK